MNKWLIGFFAILAGLIIGFYIQPVISGDNIYQQLKKIDRVFNTAYSNYVDEVDTQKLSEAAIEGMLEELDPHSIYISPKDMEKVEEDFKGHFGGIGIEFNIIEDTVTVISPIAGGPSEELGILANDKIVTIDGENAVGIPRSDVPKRLKGPKGTQVTVEIFRRGEPELLEFNITRDKIPLYSLDASFILDGTNIGMISINRFSATTHRELLKAIDELKAEGMEQLILDLRGNPGGYLNQAFLMADEFLPGGETIVFTKGRKPQFNENYMSTTGGSVEDIPLIVLVDAGSASASEIVSGAVQDLDRGLVVGVTSFGKGLVQRQFPLNDGSAFRLTISKYYTPSGRCIQRPYDNEDDYRRLVGRLELEEGNNMGHALEQLKKDVAEGDSAALSDMGKFSDLDSLIFKTKSGRPVFGGGGITPDYIIKYDTIAVMSRKIRGKNAFFFFINDFLEGKRDELKAEYEENFSNFFRNYRLSDKMMDDFKQFVIDEGIEWSEEDFKKDEDYLRNSLKAYIARFIWDREKLLQVYYERDRMVRKAVDLFPEAVKISKLN